MKKYKEDDEGLTFRAQFTPEGNKMVEVNAKSSLTLQFLTCEIRQYVFFHHFI